MSKRLGVLRELDRCQLALIAPAAQLLGQLAEHLPEQERRLGGGMQLLQQLLCDELLSLLVAIDR